MLSITVFTPTFNRVDTLQILYESLLKQSFRDFEWVIVDDGSTDNTESSVIDFKRFSPFNIKYYKQNNGGKHRAINQGVQLASGELFFIVDSDDCLLEKSLEIIISQWEQIKGNGKFAGVAGYKIYEDGKNVGNGMNTQFLDCSIIERRYRYKINGDMAEAIRTSIMREYPFPDFENEKFCAEGLIWNRISLNYDLRFFNQPIYICEYLIGGLSHNSIKNRRKSSSYTILLYSELSKNPQLSFLYKTRTILNFWRFSFANKASLTRKISMLNDCFLGVILFPIGYIFYLKDSLFNEVKINFLSR